MKYKSVWDAFRAEFKNIALDRRIQPRESVINLLVAIIVSGGEEKDTEYLYSDLFHEHCVMAGLDSTGVLNNFKEAWKEAKMNLNIPESYANSGLK